MRAARYRVVRSHVFLLGILLPLLTAGLRRAAWK
jgi:hypothetical protein